MNYFRQLWTLEARTHRSRTRLKSELPPQQVQRSTKCWRASQGGEGGCDSQRGKGCLQQRLKTNIYYSYFFIYLFIYLFILQILLYFFFLSLPLTPTLLQLSIFLTLRNPVKIFCFFFFQSYFFIVVINLCLYVGLLQFC